jgi:hypothetical protein
MDIVRKGTAGGFLALLLLWAGCAMQVDEPQPTPSSGTGSSQSTGPVKRCTGNGTVAGACLEGTITWATDDPAPAPTSTTPAPADSTNPDPMPWNGGTHAPTPAPRPK